MNHSIAFPMNGPVECLKKLPCVDERHSFILCGTESSKSISTQYKSYSLVDLYQVLHIKCILPARFLNFLFNQSTTYITIFRSQTHNPQHTTQNNQNGPLLPYSPGALPSFSLSRAAVPTTHGASAPHGPMQGAHHWVSVVNNCPQVKFLGPWDEWMKKAGKYKYLYKMDTEIA